MKPSRGPLAPATDADLISPDEPHSQLVLALMGGQVIQGPWEPRGRIRVISIMGGSKLDFRDADLLEGVTEIRIFALMGGVEIRVPADVSVQSRGLGIMGGFPTFQHTAREPDAPMLRLVGIAIMGGVEVKVG